jgi:DNA-directed RNA polymerase subunit E'
MYYKVEVSDHIRVPPHLFELKLEDALVQKIKKKYEGYISEEMGVVIDVLNIKKVGEGVILSGDGASYYETTFDLLAFKPELQEVILAKVRDITDFGAFFSLGPIEGMVHVSQSMDDFVSFSKEKVLTGKNTKRSLKVGDVCKTRIIAVSYKDVTNPKIGLTMRQKGLGKLDWIDEDLAGKPEKEVKEKPAKKEKK